MSDKQNRTGPTLPDRLSVGHPHDMGGTHYIVHVQQLSSDGGNVIPVGGLSVPMKVMARNRGDVVSLAAEIVRRYNAAPELLAFVEKVANRARQSDPETVDAARALLAKVRP